MDERSSDYPSKWYHGAAVFWGEITSVSGLEKISTKHAPPSEYEDKIIKFHRYEINLK